MYKINTKLLSEAVPKYHKYIEGEGQKWKKERKAKDEFFAKYFSKQQIPKIDEGILRDMIHILWAYNGWTNKDYLLQEALTSGLDIIRKGFDKLLYGEGKISERFDYLVKNVRMMGAACASEVLAHHDHRKYPIWNQRSKAGLIWLGVPPEVLPKSAQISGKQYEAFLNVVGDVRSQVAAKYPEFDDYFTLDFLLYYISVHKDELTGPPRPTVTTDDFDHNAVIDQVLQLGDGLGFDVEKEFSITQGCRVDVIWRSRIANLGTIMYAFEVHRKGSRDSAILNLQRVKRDPSIQKVIIVSSEEELQVFRREISSLDEDFRNSVGYFEVTDLQSALENLEILKDTLENLGLMSIGTFSV